MRIGLVSPYSFDVPGGVQLHVRDLATYLLAEGHEVSVLAPSDGDDAGAPYVTSAGGAMPIRYNGSVARLAFGPVAASRTARWVERGDYGRIIGGEYPQRADDDKASTADEFKTAARTYKDGFDASADPLITTLRRLAGIASTACTSARIASGLWP